MSDEEQSGFRHDSPCGCRVITEPVASEVFVGEKITGWVACVTHQAEMVELLGDQYKIN